MRKFRRPFPTFSSLPMAYSSSNLAAPLLILLVASVYAVPLRALNIGLHANAGLSLVSLRTCMQYHRFSSIFRSLSRNSFWLSSSKYKLICCSLNSAVEHVNQCSVKVRLYLFCFNIIGDLARFECRSMCWWNWIAAPPFLRYGKYCGLLYTGCPGEQPCDRLDACCMHHDQCISKMGSKFISSLFSDFFLL